ncbi:MAG TPA: hypothetical protein VKB04_09235 [Anaerolineales bacterium]|nr:hypothetical protein [Anaerolineales bacterium]
MNSSVVGILLIVVGVLMMLGAALNWRIATRGRKLFNFIFGDTVAQIIYFVAGIFIFIMGIGRPIGVN